MVTNFDKSFEKYIRSLILKNFDPLTTLLLEKSLTIKSDNHFQWSIDPIDGTRAFVIGAPTWSNLIGLSFNEKSKVGLANFPELNKFYINDKKKILYFQK